MNHMNAMPKGSSLDFLIDHEQLTALEMRVAGLSAQQGAEYAAAAVELAWHLRQRATGRALEMCRDLRQQSASSPLPAAALARIALIEAEASILYARFDAASQHIGDALRRFNECNDQTGVGDAHVARSMLAAARGDVKRWYQELLLARTIFVGVEDRNREQLCHAWATLANFDSDSETALADVASIRAAGEPADGVAVLLAMIEGFRAFDGGESAEAARIFRVAEPVAERCGMRVYQIRLLFSIAAALSNLDDKDGALPWLERALTIGREARWPLPTGEALATLGNLYREMGYLDRSLETLGEALQWLEVAPQSRGYALAQCYAGHAQLAASHYAVAAQCGQRAADVARAMSSWSLVVDGLIVLARAQSRLGEVESAFTAAREALLLAQKFDMGFWQIDALRALASVHGEHAQSTPNGVAARDAALHYLDEASAATRNQEGYAEIVDLLTEIAQAHERAGDFKSALAAEREARAAGGRIERQRIANRMLSSELKHQAETQRLEAAHMRRLATIDFLTGIPNRRYFMELADAEAQRSRRTGATFAVVMADIDKFKTINDSLGHAAGDMVIASVARTLDAGKRTIDSLGRLGGEEFCLILPETDEATARVAVERFRFAIESALFQWQAKRVAVTMSFGVVISGNDEADSIENLLQSADTALYRAKEQGRNRVEIAY